MKLKYIIIILSLIFAFSGVEALNLKETIAVKGNGNLYARTNIPYAIDLAQGFGTQTYTRAFGYQSAISGSFTSKYVLKSAHGDGSYLYPVDMIDENSKHKLNAISGMRGNRYLIGMVDPNKELQYIASINGISDIYSDNSVELINNEYGFYQIATKYDIGGQGVLEEKITDSRGSLHPTILTEARANGLFNLTSEAEDEIQVPLSEIHYASPEYLSSKISLYDKSKEGAQNTGDQASAGYLARYLNRGNGSFAEEMLQSYTMTNNIFNRPVACYKPSPV